jgi:ribosomal protein S18 acetylase RimI-like enzyme
MKISRRPFSGHFDLLRMAALINMNPDNHLHVTDLPYRFSSWALDDPGNVGLWFDLNDQLLAWVVFQTPFWTIDLAFHPQADRDLRRLLWNWADRRAHDILDTPYGHPAWFVNVFADQVETIRELESIGFTLQADVGADSWSKVFMRCYSNSAHLEVSLPAGFTIRPLVGDSEVEAYVELHRSVFGTRNMTVEWRRRTLRQPGYIPGLDLVAVTPGGRLAAFCIAWLNQDKTGEISGQIEPMGVQSDYRRLGLGRAILSENLQRTFQYGAKQAVVETDSYRNPALALYEAVGFRVFREILVYRKDYPVG